MIKPEQSIKLREMKIEVTHKCLIACIHCSSDASPSCQKEIARDKCLDILCEARDLGIETVTFSGGKPLLWEPLGEAVKYAASNNIAVPVYTSGNVNDTFEYFQYLKTGES